MGVILFDFVVRGRGLALKLFASGGCGKSIQMLECEGAPMLKGVTTYRCMTFMFDHRGYLDRVDSTRTSTDRPSLIVMLHYGRRKVALVSQLSGSSRRLLVIASTQTWVLLKYQRTYDLCLI